MANRIKGITVEIGGDTQGLQKSLKGVDSQLKTTQSSLRDVERLLKLDPKNTELLAQKQRLLSEAIENTSKRLETLKTASEQARKQLERGDLGQDEYDALQREIVETEGKLDGLKRRLGSTDGAFDTAGKSAKTFGDNLKSAGSKLDKVAGKTKLLSSAAAGLAGAAFATVPATQELRGDLSLLDANAENAGVSIEEARDGFTLFNSVVGETDSSVEAMSNLFMAGFSGNNLQSAIEGVTGAFSQFPDTLKIESLADSLQETLATGKATGQFAEYLDRVGIGAEKFSIGLSKCKTDTEKQNYALQAFAEGGATQALEKYQESNEELLAYNEAITNFQTAMAQLAEVLLPVITPIIEAISRLVQKFTELPQKTQNVIMVAIGLVAVLGPVLSMLSRLAFTASTVGPVFTKMGGIVKFALGGIKTALKIVFTVIKANPVMATVSIVIGAVLLLYSKCEWFRNGVKAVLNFLKDAVIGVKNKVVDTFNSVKNAMSNLVSSVKSKAQSISSAIVNGFSNAITFLTELPSKALQWGSDFVEGLKQGIMNKIHAVVDAVEGIAEKIASFLHFSRPDEGPLHEYETWMPDFMSGLAKGIRSNQYMVEKAIEDTAGKMTGLNANMQNSITANFNYSQLRNAFGAVMGNMQTAIVMDNREVGRSLRGMGVQFK